MKKDYNVPFSKLNGDLKILLVDDDPIIQLLHRKIVADIVPDLPVITCKHGAEAIDYIKTVRALKPSFLVLLDINMPVMNGWEFLEECQENQFDNIKVVVVSSSINHSDRTRAAGFPQVFRYCEKPLNKLTFTEIILQKEVEPFFTRLQSTKGHPG